MGQYSIGRAILEILGEVGVGTLEVFFPRKYSYTRIWRPLLGLERARALTPKTVSTVLWRLKCEGLIVRVGSKKKARWELTTMGNERRQETIRLLNQKKKSDGVMRLVIFDIPERERKKRDILRAELIECDFQQLQKSVWQGEHPLPESFVGLLDELALADKVHIFSVREKGTIAGLK